jgi:hypothetical protein
VPAAFVAFDSHGHSGGLFGRRSIGSPAGEQHDGPLSTAALSLAWSASSTRAPLATQEARFLGENSGGRQRGGARIERVRALSAVRFFRLTGVPRRPRLRDVRQRR